MTSPRRTFAGNCNVLKEIVEPAGAKIDVRKIPLGDDSLSVLEIWGAEYQEQDNAPKHGQNDQQCDQKDQPVWKAFPL